MLFENHFVPANLIADAEDELNELKQHNLKVDDYERRFNQIMNDLGDQDEEWKIRRFYQGLRCEICDKMVENNEHPQVKCTTLNELISRATVLDRIH